MGSTNKVLQPVHFLKVLIQQACLNHSFGSPERNDPILKEQTILSPFCSKMMHHSVKPPILCAAPDF